jgi:hypothetical protein
VGGTATFSVGATGGLPALSYQWRMAGTNVTGATSNSLTINNAQPTNAGAYAVVVTDSLGQSVTSPTAALTVGTPGTGTGLNGDYYTSQTNFAGVPTLSRVDSTVNFNFGTGSPDPLISTDHFSIRWTGKVQPFYSQTYTFYTTTDDGVRLWVNGQKLIDKWVNQGPTEWSGTVALNANQQYPIVMEYYENTGGAQATLSWSSPNQVKQIIPQTQLYPGVAAQQPTLNSSTGGNGTSLLLNWAGSYALQTATNADGPYATIPGASSTYTVNMTNSHQFFRLLSQ